MATLEKLLNASKDGSDDEDFDPYNQPGGYDKRDLNKCTALHLALLNRCVTTARGNPKTSALTFPLLCAGNRRA